MKVVRVQGGLGNQLFCLAFARSVALTTGAPVALDVASYLSDRYGHQFTLADMARELGAFRIENHPWRSSRPRRLLARLIRTPAYVVEGPAPASRGELESLVKRGVYFDGYWQNEAFILDLEGFALAFRREIARRAAPVEAAGTIIHYRTYKEERLPWARGVPGPDFFRRAMSVLAAGESLGEVFLVSDDPDLALERLGDIGAPVTALKGGTAWDDMARMAVARNLVLTNSSFSWWGGVCADAQRIIYPVNQGFTHYPRPAAKFLAL